MDRCEDIHELIKATTSCKSVHLAAGLKRPGSTQVGSAYASRSHPVLILHPNNHLHGNPNEPVSRVPHNEHVPGDAALHMHIAEDLARVANPTTLGVPVGQAPMLSPQAGRG